MGRYQWELFVVIGFGWASDNLWPIVTSLIFTPIANEFSPGRPPYLTLAQNIGLLAGAMFWGFGCDICKLYLPVCVSSTDNSQSDANGHSTSPSGSPPSGASSPPAPQTLQPSASSTPCGPSASAGICQWTRPYFSSSSPGRTSTSSPSCPSTGPSRRSLAR